MIPSVLIESLPCDPLNHSPNYSKAKIRILVMSPRLFIVEDALVVIQSILMQKFSDVGYLVSSFYSSSEIEEVDVSWIAVHYRRLMG